MKRADIVAVAREELDTPYHHQGRAPGAGLDCLGLLVITARKLGLAVDDMTNYSMFPDANFLLAKLAEHIGKIPIEEAGVGDVLVFSYAGNPQHMGIITQADPQWIIHSYAPKPVKRVVEIPLDAQWRRRIHSAWRLPNLED